MEFKLNSSPYLKMQEITRKLFNRNFLSDVQFGLNGKIIYAHSFELMKRSVVFEEQLEETLGEQKLILITDCTYDIFLEFVRFIYMDECNINAENGIELLKLAIKYQILMLENQILNSSLTFDSIVQLFEYCTTKKYDIAQNFIDRLFASTNVLSTRKFATLHPDAVNKAVQFDVVAKGVTEIQIFNALAGWINNYCKTNNISLSEGRQQFEGLIRMVRFPTMSNEEIRECYEKHPQLLCENDFNSIMKQIVFGSDSGHDLWISKRRDDFKPIVKWNQVNRDTLFETKFSVSQEIILHGIRIGTEITKTDIEIKISAKSNKTNEIKRITFLQSSPVYWGSTIIDLGHSLRLEPNCEYTIAVKYLEITNEYISVCCREENIDVVHNDPNNSIRIIKASDNMIEMWFKAPPV